MADQARHRDALSAIQEPVQPSALHAAHAEPERTHVRFRAFPGDPPFPVSDRVREADWDRADLA